jgi:DNA-binding beta-propeller fold protein YncE
MAVGLGWCVLLTGLGRWAAQESTPGSTDRSPVDLVLTADEQWMLTANQTAGTVSLVNIASGKVHAETPCGRRPSALALTPDGKRVLVSGTHSGDVTVLERVGDRLDWWSMSSPRVAQPADIAHPGFG